MSLTPVRGIIAGALALCLAAAIFAASGQAVVQCDGHTVTMTGTAGPDTIFGTTGVDVIAGLGGDDVITGDGGNDIICGGDGADSLVGDDGNDRLFGEGEDDFMLGRDGNDHLEGGDGDDYLSTRAGTDELLGGDGADSLEGGEDPDQLDGGPGQDLLTFYFAQLGVSVDLEAGTSDDGLGEDTLTGLESIVGSAQGDELLGDDGVNFIDGGDGSDYMEGRGGTDFLDYSDPETDGPVTVNFTGNGLPGSQLGIASGADGNDQFAGFEGAIGTSQDDTLIGDKNDNFFEGLDGDDEIDGAGGKDDVLYGVATDSVTVSLVTGTSAGPAGRDELSSVENIEGSDFADTLIGDGGDNQLSGGAGNDKLYGRGGYDNLLGGDGEDKLFGGEGTEDFASFADRPQGVVANLGTGSAVSGGEEDRMLGIEALEGTQSADTLQGGSGEDLFSGLDGADLIDGGPATDFVVYRSSTGGDLGDLSVGPVDVNLATGKGDDLSDPTDGTGDTLVSIAVVGGSPGDDIIHGSDGNELFLGFAGDDQIYGGGGNDGIEGGAGADTMDGESGVDQIVYFLEPAVTADVGAGTATSGGDTDTLVDPEILVGSPEGDTLTGSAQNDFLIGEAGKDRLRGLGGEDALVGGGVGITSTGSEAGTPTIVGGKDLLLDGGPDSDSCLGKPASNLVNCESNTLSDEQQELLLIIAKLIDDIKHHHGARLSG